MKIETPTVIIGAGPAGLAIAGRLRHLGADFTMLEQSNRIANSWQNHYHRLHLHTVKRFSELPHMPFPKEYPNYVPRQELVDYYEDYAEKMEIKPHFGEEVISVKKEGDLWQTKTKSEKIYLSKSVVVCTGFNRIPYRPTFKKEELYKGQILHSRDYRTAKNYKGQKVLVVGMGNTGAEIALDLYEEGAQSFLSVRGPINIVPRDFIGRPLQESARLLRKLPFPLGDWIGNQVQKIAIGDLTPYGITTPKIAPAKQLREFAKTPVLDLGTVKEIKAGNIKVLPDIDFFTEKGVVFKNGKQEDFSAVILATGYRALIENFLEETEGLFNEFQIPKQAICKGKKEGLFFLGFDGYSNGLLDSIYQNSKKMIQEIVK